MVCSPWTRSQGSEIHRVERYKIFQEKVQKSEDQDQTLKQGNQKFNSKFPRTRQKKSQIFSSVIKSQSVDQKSRFIRKYARIQERKTDRPEAMKDVQTKLYKW